MDKGHATYLPLNASLALLPSIPVLYTYIVVNHRVVFALLLSDAIKTLEGTASKLIKLTRQFTSIIIKTDDLKLNEITTITHLFVDLGTWTIQIERTATTVEIIFTLLLIIF